MLIKILFGASVILAGLFLAIPEFFSSLTSLGVEPFIFGRLVGIAAVAFEAWWLVRHLSGK